MLLGEDVLRRQAVGEKKKNGDDEVWEEQVCQNWGSVNEYFRVVSPVVRKKEIKIWTVNGEGCISPKMGSFKL